MTTTDPVPSPLPASPAPVAADERPTDRDALRELCGGAVHLPGDPGYDAARTPWNLAVDQRPAAVAHPASTEEVVDVVRAAVALGLRVAPQGTGHNAGALGDLFDVVLLRTSAMRQVTVDAEAGRARVGAGALWLDVVEAAAAAGVSVLHGSSPDVGVVGYSLGGGIGWYARQLGMQANAITGAEVVDADGHVRWVDAGSDPERFWALRGGGGNVGIVTQLEFRTFPFTTAYAGMLVWDWRDAARVLWRWVEWARTAPDMVTTSFRFLHLPDLPELPDALRGRDLVVIDGAVLADDVDAEAVLAPLRELQPELDTFTRVPTETLVRLHMDPEEPVPGESRSTLLASLPAEAIVRLLELAGPGSGPSPLMMVELRQLGGALARPAPDAGVLASLDGEFLLFAGGMAMTPEMGAASIAAAEHLVASMEPWSDGRRYLNFTEQPTDVASGYEAERWARLRRIRAAVDPRGTIVANHPVPTAAD